MINKSSLWFLTVSSIIIVLSIYYSVVPRDNLNMVFSNVNSSINDTDEYVVESTELTAMKVMKEENELEEIKKLQNILLNIELSASEKNEAYNQIKYLNSIKSLEEKLENKLEEQFKVSNFIELKNYNAIVVIANKEKNMTLANDIISFINKELNYNYYVTVKFN